jgi:hypothetical protein
MRHILPQLDQSADLCGIARLYNVGNVLAALGDGGPALKRGP